MLTTPFCFDGKPPKTASVSNVNNTNLIIQKQHTEFPRIVGKSNTKSIFHIAITVLHNVNVDIACRRKRK